MHFSTSPARRATLAALLAAGALALAGCAALQPQTAEQVVAERAEARWTALIDGDPDIAWEYTQPGYRAVVTKKQYSRRFGGAGQWTGAQVHGVTCQAERCTVKVRLTSRVLVPKFMGKEITGFFDETWVREDGQWWYFQAL